MCVCIRVVSEVNGLASADSNEKCVTMPADPGAGSTSPQATTVGPTPPTSIPPTPPESTTSTPTTTTPTPTPGAFTGADWIIFAAVPTTTADGKPPPNFVTLKQKLNDAKIPAGLYDRREYPGTRMNGNPVLDGWVVYAGPYAGEAAAQAACDEVLKVTGGSSGCDIGQPKPP